MHVPTPSSSGSDSTLTGLEHLVLDRLNYVISTILRDSKLDLEGDSLVWRDADDLLRIHRLDGSCQIGRSADNDLQIDDPHLSREHCTLSQEHGSWWIRDAGSRNGTWKNRKPVKLDRLHSGDVIRIGSTQLVLIEHDEIEPTPNPA